MDRVSRDPPHRIQGANTWDALGGGEQVPVETGTLVGGEGLEPPTLSV